MLLTVYSYPTCGTCRKAKKWLDEHALAYQDIHIVESPPTKADLTGLYEKSGLPLKKFFNTSGRRYRELGIRDKIKTATDDELLNWLASDGMLIKRPIITDGQHVTVGFNEALFTETWK
ncbi:arsenate reductase [Scopulibacillus darangshiensis]|uniref:Arsenate reductase n=1 Tax=Scopulibacillus darangshiensis TaxID=442528 RepID=A0A4R2NNY0_9BACL|nr:arsenate reductase family protein [Scopulibacillus darangshiensis]TCP23499.1 arsenate reductase [Scopulibacillus darangshiensis]